MKALFFTMKYIAIIGITLFPESLDNRLFSSYQVEVEELINKYIESFVSYANSPNERDAAFLQLELLDYFESSSHFHYNDLFYNDEQSKMSVETYLALIVERYGNSIETTIKDLELIDCIEKRSNSESYATIRFVKEMKYKDETKSVENIVKVNINHRPLRINMIGMPEDFSESPQCDYEDKKKANGKEEQKNADKYFQLGERWFSTNEYIYAIEAYKKAKHYNSNFPGISDKINRCNELITIKEYILKGNNYFEDKQYAVAREFYQKAISIGSDQISYARSREQECTNLIKQHNFDMQVRNGDLKFEKGYYPKAKYYYQKALQFSSNTSLIDKKIRECENRIKKPHGNFASVKDAIYQAKRLASKNKYDDAFMIFDQYKESGQLDKEAYYIMAMILYKNADGVQRKMKYNKRQAFNYCRLYMLKAKSMGHDKATHMYNNVFSRKIK